MALKRIRVTSEDIPPEDMDVQRTSLSLDVLGRFICNTYEEATANEDFDVVVIGSGMYGAYCAAKVYSESAAKHHPLRVLVLEAGPFLIPEHSQNIPNLGLYAPDAERPSSAPDVPRNLVWGHSWRGNDDAHFADTAYCVGGKSLFWGGWCPRLQPADLEQWPDAVREYLTGTPATHNLPNRPSSLKVIPPGETSTREQQSVYEAVEFEIGVKPADDFIFDPLLGPHEPDGHLGLNKALELRIKDALDEFRRNGTFLGEVPATDAPGIYLSNPEPPPIAVRTQSFTSGLFSPDKYSSLPLLTYARRDDRNKSNDRIFIVPNAHVSKLSVPPVNRDGSSRDGYRVSEVEVWVEGVPRKLKIKSGGTVVLALGCIESTRLALESFPSAPDPKGEELMGRNLMAHHRFDLKFKISREDFAKWLQDNGGKQLRVELQVASFHIQAHCPSGRFHLQVYASGTVGGSADGLIYNMIPDSTIAERLAAEQDENYINVMFRGCGEMAGNRDAPVGGSATNWINLADPADSDVQFDHRRARVHYADQTHAPIWEEMTQAAIALAQSMGGIEIQKVEPKPVGSSWHESGTLFMGEDPLTSVTDVSGHFHRISNAVCVDQGLFPTVGSANPVLTGLCLSRRAAEMIVNRHLTTETPPLDGFTDLLDASHVSRWKTNAGNIETVIEDGTVVVSGNSGEGVLFYDDPNLFDNFELHAQWRTFLDENGEPTANSGIFLRAPDPTEKLNDGNFYSQAIEIQIDDTGYDGNSFRSPKHRTGAIYGIAPARVWSQKIPGTEWNEFRITASGTQLTVLLNGELVSQGEVPVERRSKGTLALQCHTGRVEFRSIRIQRR
ncbi:family 16 glycoside hydrolase [Nocardia sp. NPDC052278]|uniref:family 16 glycoside hydrolase n=1 Tax=unclassified Nocardia TaxID=2637762 RepID=UPI00367D1E98